MNADPNSNFIESHYYGAEHPNYNGIPYQGVGLVGTVITSQYNFSSYHWVSMANTKPNTVVGGRKLGNPFCDGTFRNGYNINWPFYNSQNSPLIQGSFYVSFNDHPAVPSSISNYSFSANTTLYGTDGAMLMTYSWGYSINIGNLNITPIHVIPYQINSQYLNGH